MKFRIHGVSTDGSRRAVTSKGATLELAVLGLLHDSPLHGYELRKRLNLLLGWTRLLSYGSLYPALKRMLRGRPRHRGRNRQSGSLPRQRIVYQITAAGTEFFAGKITDVGPSAWEDEDFNMRFAFFSRTDSEVRLRILEGRRSRLQERLDRARTNRDPQAPTATSASCSDAPSIELMNVSLIVAHEPKWRKFLLERPAEFTLLMKRDSFFVFERASFKSSYFVEGDGEVLDQGGPEVRVTLSTPDAVIKFNYFPFLEDPPPR